MPPTFIKEVDYVCECQSIHIKVTHQPNLGAATIYFYINNNEALSLTYKFSFPRNRDDYDIFLKNVCDLLFNNLEMDEFTDYLPDDSCLKGEYVYKFLERIKSKGGTTIWSRT